MSEKKKKWAEKKGWGWYNECECYHPLNEKGEMIHGWGAGCLCGRIHPLRVGKDGKKYMSTGWY